MRQNGASRTAKKVAMMRAAHQILDRPIVFEDPLALEMIGHQGISNIRADKRKYKTRLRSRLRAIVVARSRFVEDALSVAIKRGVRQYVVLGAGLDTFAYRNPYSNEGLKVFEVDHPATQEWKRRQLDAAKIPVPDNVILAPIDFEKQRLAERLREAGLQENEPTFFSWLGVIMYLKREAMMATLNDIASATPAGSEIIFDYIIPPFNQNRLRRFVFRLMARKVAAAGEPWQSLLDPIRLAADLNTAGFSYAEDIGPDKINATYFTNRTDKLMVGNFGHLMRAQV